MAIIPISFLVLLIYPMKIREMNAANCSDSSSTQGISVIIFFANSTNYSKSANGMRSLKLDEVAKVRGSVSDGHQHKQTCKELVKNNVEYLVRYSQNALGMKTGVVNISNKKACESSNQSGFAQTLEKYDNNPNKQNSPPPRTYRIPNESIDILPSDSDDEDNVDSAYNDLITGRSHKEIFRIRHKRDTFVEEHQGEIPNIPLEKKKSNSWDVLDIMSHVRFSFFGNFFDEASHRPPADQNDLISRSGFKEDAGLYDAVCSTFEQLQLGGKGEFLLVVFGGHLSEICDTRSAIIRSIKHLLENTDKDKTLVVVTGSCDDDERDVMGYSRGDNNCKSRQRDVPVFAKGPKHEKLCRSKYVYDIPMAVKSILAEVAPNFEDETRKFKIKDVPAKERKTCNRALYLKNMPYWKVISAGNAFISIYSIYTNFL